MKIRSSRGKPSRLDTGPPDPINVEPAGLRDQAGQNRRHQIATNNNSLSYVNRQAHGLVAIRYALPLPVWICIRQACLKREVRRHG
jgi:hypothetical protein